MTDTITIPVNRKAAQIYRAASDEQRLKIQMLLSFFLENSRPSPDALLRRMDAISDQAQARGLTPEILEAILNDPDEA
nr:hypothetical protein [Oscillochloris trichoides]